MSHIYIMTYSQKFKAVAKQFTGKIINVPKIFKISKSTYYYWKNAPVNLKPRNL